MMKHAFLILSCLLISISLFASERSLYDFSWLDKDKEIYVLQNRKFRKDGKLYLGLTGAKTVSGAFVDAYGGTLRGGFFFSEDWGIELVYGKNFGSENATAKAVKEQGSVPFYRKIDNYTGGMLVWSPFYSKINTFNQIFYFDWMFGLGAANVTTLDNRKLFEIPASSSLTSESNVGILWNTGLRFYINESWSLRMDFTGLHYQANRARKQDGDTESSASKAMFSNFDFGLGLNYSF